METGLSAWGFCVYVEELREYCLWIAQEPTHVPLTSGDNGNNDITSK